MATIAVAPIVLKDYTLRIDADNFEKAVDAVTFTPPSTTGVEWHGPMGTDFYDAIEQGLWSCQVGYAQDWTTPGSLSRYLHAHAGETAAVEFVPSASNAAMPSFTTSLVIAAGPIGGTTRQVAAGSVTMQCTSKPVLVEP